MPCDQELKCPLAGFGKRYLPKVNDLIISLCRIVVLSRSLIYPVNRELNNSASIAFPNPHFDVISPRAGYRHLVSNKLAWCFRLEKDASFVRQIIIIDTLEPSCRIRR